MKYLEEESSTLELKKDIPQNDQIIKTIIGFCNQKGGKLILGVDIRGNIVGISDEKTQKIMEYIHKSIFEASSPPIIPLVYSQRIADKTILIIEVSSGMNKPYYRKVEGLEKGTYIRLGRSTLRATADMIEELKWQSRGRSYDMMPVYHSKEEDLNREQILEFLNLRKTSKIKTLNKEILFSYQWIIEEHSSIYCTVGGMLLFGKNSQKFFPEGMILCSHFSGITGREAMASLNCTGTIIEQFHTAYNFIIRRLEHSFSIRGIKRKEKLEIPEEALREALMNAIVHRSYNIPAPIKIAIYDNRIEIFSPGIFPGPLDPHNLKMGLTYIRNHVICKVFHEWGFMEKLGSGFLTIFNSYEKAKLPSPEIVEGENFVKCILPRSTFFSKTARVTEDDQKILHLFAMAEEINISDVMKALQLSRPTAGRRLADLKKRKILEQVGEGKATHYRKIKK